MLHRELNRHSALITNPGVCDGCDTDHWRAHNCHFSPSEARGSFGVGCSNLSYVSEAVTCVAPAWAADLLVLPDTNSG